MEVTILSQPDCLGGFYEGGPTLICGLYVIFMSLFPNTIIHSNNIIKISSL